MADLDVDMDGRLIETITESIRNTCGWILASPALSAHVTAADEVADTLSHL
jgi:hypothetical protein